MTSEDVVIKKSMVPGFLYQQHRRHLAIEDPLETGWIVLKRRWYWIGLKAWTSITIYASLHFNEAESERFVPDRAVTNDERVFRVQLAYEQLKLLTRNSLTT